MVQESKLDESFPSSQFSVSGFNSYRKDMSDNAGGLLMYVCGDLPRRRRLDVEPNSEETPSGRVEIMTVEIALKKKSGYVVPCTSNQKCMTEN